MTTASPPIYTFSNAKEMDLYYMLFKTLDNNEYITFRIFNSIIEKTKIEFQNKYGLSANWSDENFNRLFDNISRSCMNNLDSASHVHNQTLKECVLSGKMSCDKLAFFHPYEFFPGKWDAIIEDKQERERVLDKIKEGQYTTSFIICPKCHEAKCTYVEAQLRSADESADLIVTCMNCGHHFKR
jgi:DNA-directed RNA polymerase subunit M/transcription elongation factor TFIIS